MNKSTFAKCTCIWSQSYPNYIYFAVIGKTDWFILGFRLNLIGLTTLSSCLNKIDICVSGEESAGSCGRSAETPSRELRGSVGFCVVWLYEVWKILWLGKVFVAFGRRSKGRNRRYGFIHSCINSNFTIYAFLHEASKKKQKCAH